MRGPRASTPVQLRRADLVGGGSVLLNRSLAGGPDAGNYSAPPVISGAGDRVSFSTNADQLVAGDTNGRYDAFVRFMGTGQTRYLSAGLPVGANPSGVVISPNGQWVSSRWDDGSLHLTRVSTGATVTVAAEAYALTGAFSSLRGRYVFVSGGAPFVRDLATGVDTPIAVPPDGFVTTVTISGNGRYAAFDWTPAEGGATQVLRVAL